VTELAAMLGAELVAAIEQLIDQRVSQALAEERAAAKRWLTIRETGAYLGCGERAVYQRIRRGRIPAAAVKRSGRSVLVDREALDRGLERLT